MTKRNRGQLHHKAKLSNEDVMGIIQVELFRRAGISTTTNAFLSQVYDLDPKSIYKIVHGLAWKHLWRELSQAYGV